jgi:glycosyltransferase involved in cell wall biosynthesis
VSGVVEVIRHGVNGLLVAPGSASELAGAILELQRQPQTRARLGAAARQTVAAHYSQEAMLRRLESLYLELLGDRAPQAAAAPGTSRPD